MTTITFADLGLSESTLVALNAKGFKTPSPIQAQVIPLLLKESKDIIGQAQTGTGKTAAFGLPLIEKLKPGKGVQGLVLAPTRELALQVCDEINSLQGDKGLRIVSVYGGQPMRDQLRALKDGVDLIVGTPGRVIDHLDRQSLALDKLKFLVLDEADEMLKMGFIEAVETIINASNPKRRMLMFSATMPAALKQIAERYMGETETVAVKKTELTTNLTKQMYFEVRDRDKLEALCRIIDVDAEFYGVVFCRTKLDVDELAAKLLERGHSAEGLHGDIEQDQREKILGRFRKGHINILVATDVAARGIDVQELTHVVNFSLPQNPETYVHRIGRTGRAGREGTAITLVSPSDVRKLQFIERITKAPILKGKLPTVAEVVDSKLRRLQTEINTMMVEDAVPETYHALATKLLKKGEAEAVLAATLFAVLGTSLDHASYAEIAEPQARSQSPKRFDERRDDRQHGHRDERRDERRDDMVTLTVNKGRKHDLNPQKLAQAIMDVAKTRPHKIKEIKMFDNDALVTVTASEADFILRAFKRSGTKMKLDYAKK